MFSRWILLIVMAQAMPVVAALQDPTRPPSAAPATANAPTPGATSGPRWTLTSTLVSPTRRSAVINDQVLSVGDRIGGAQVVDIQADSVRLRIKGREVTLRLLNTNIKQAAKPARSDTP